MYISPGATGMPDTGKPSIYVAVNRGYDTCFGEGLVMGYANCKYLRGHLGVPDTVSEPLNVPLNYLVILHLIHLKAYILLKADNF